MENEFAVKGEREISMCGSRYVQYNILRNLFQVCSKYVPPIQPVGRGTYGIICRATNSETREPVAIKKITNAFDNIIDAKITHRKIKILGHMDHDNIIKIKDIIRRWIRKSSMMFILFVN